MNVKTNLTIAVSAALVTSLPTTAFALTALEEWTPTARDSLSTVVKAWLGLMMLTNIASLAFVKNHVAARWVFAGFAISHVIVMFLWSQDVPVLAGQVSLLHLLFWTPGAIMLLKRRAEIKIPSTYGIWACVSLFFYVVSMSVDIPAAWTGVMHVLAS